MAEKALIFDFDGLICDTEWATYEVWRDVFTAHDADLTVQTWLQAVGHHNAIDFRELLNSVTGRALDWEKLDPEIDADLQSRIRRLAPLPGVKVLMEHAANAGWPVGVASNSSTEWVRGGMEQLGLLPLVKVIRTRDDVIHPKPDPDVYLAVVEALNASPENTIAFEDSQPGVASAKAAGLHVIAVPNRLTQHHDLSAADEIVSSLEAVASRIAGTK